MRNLEPDGKNMSALALDFDGTAIEANMIDPLLLMRGKRPANFWSGVDILSLCGVDPIVAFIRQFEEACTNGAGGVTDLDLARVGTDLELLPGLIETISDARAVATAVGIELKVLVLTTGFETVVRFSELARHVDAIVGTTWHISRDGTLSSPDRIISPDAKANVLSELAEVGLPANGIPAIPGHRIGFIGDGLTDFPGFQFLADAGGASLLVHRGGAAATQTAHDQTSSCPGLCSAPRDYRRGSPAHVWLMRWLAAMSTNRNEIFDEVI